VTNFFFETYTSSFEDPELKISLKV